MNFLSFQKQFAGFPFIKAADVHAVFPKGDKNALTRWQKNGYVVKIRNGLYRIAEEAATTEFEMFLLSNHIYSPSYVSLQSAFSYYGFIPEGVFMITAVATMKTKSFSTPFAVFSYRKINPKLFFGYDLLSHRSYQFKMAKPEKAILDFLYLNPAINDQASFEALRFNWHEMAEVFDFQRFQHFLSAFDNEQLKKRARLFEALLKKHITI